MKRFFGIKYFFLFVFFCFLFTQDVFAAYPSGCSSCQTAGSWCVEPGSGYQCGSGSSCGARISSSVNCPAGCTCGRYAYIGGSTSCSNDCIKVESCSASSPTPSPPATGECTTPGEYCVSSSWWTSSGQTPTNCGQIGKSGSFGACGGGFCCSEPSAPPPPSCTGEGLVATVQCNNQNPCSGVTCCVGSCFTANQTQRSVADCQASCGYDNCWAVDAYCPAPPSCTVSINGGSASVSVEEGASTSLTISYSEIGVTSRTAYFSSNDTTVATVNPNTDTTTPFSTSLTGISGGTAVSRVTVSVSGNGLNASCSDSINVTVNPGVKPWWRIIDGDVLTSGNLVSLIPNSTSFDLRGAGGFPGLPVYGGTSADFSADTGSTGSSAEGKDWIANSNYHTSLERYNYSFFSRQIPSDVVINNISGSITTATLAGGTQTRGYKWFKVVGNASTSGDISIGSNDKVILLVEEGDLNINGLITIASSASRTSFFMAMVGKRSDGTGGNIIVSPTVGSASTDLWGIYAADGQFSTGTTGLRNDTQLGVKGVVTAQGGLLLQRNRGSLANAGGASESFEYSPQIINLFPAELKRDRIRWQEVAP